MPVNVLESGEELPREGDVRLRGRGRRGPGLVIHRGVWPRVVRVVRGVWLLGIGTA